MNGRELLIGVTGGIAAYKTAALVSRLVQSGAGVSVVQTEAATRFVGPTTFAALTGRNVHSSLFDGPEYPLGGHIALAENAALLCVAPATANFLAKAASGIADDLLSTLYLVWGLGAQMHVKNLAHQAMTERAQGYERLLAQPTPFNTMLWRILAVSRDHYHVGYYSLLDSSETISMLRFESAPELLDGLESHWPVQRLKWFTHGFYSVDAVADGVVISDLRMGVEPYFAFRFKVAELANPHPVPATDTRLPNRAPWDQLPRMFRRIWDESVVFNPAQIR